MPLEIHRTADSLSSPQTEQRGGEVGCELRGVAVGGKAESLTLECECVKLILHIHIPYQQNSMQKPSDNPDTN